ncbi:MAG: hypothetical protein LWX54_17455 [Deltaproteobacteria bacterium]|jgi:vacuolar-type H+-ATPase subunit I/STV1|nr:hypothetical protein [Deltaproteobacteria bacterium]
MTRNEKITIFTAVIGLVADVVTITGLLSGFVIPKPEVSLLLSKSAISIISLSLCFYFEAVILVFIYKFYYHRIELSGITRPNKDSSREGYVMAILSYTIWTPSYLLWLLWVFSTSHGFFLTVLGLLGIAIGGILLILISAALYEVLFPYDDVESKSTPLNKSVESDQLLRAGSKD